MGEEETTPRRRRADPIVEEIRDDVKEIKVLLIGNGKPEEGLIFKHAVLSLEVKGLHDEHAAVKGWLLKVLGLALIPVAAAILGLTFG